jgi:hypothetical protein
MIDSISAQGTTVTRTESIKEERKALYSILLRIGGQTKFLKLQKMSLIENLFYLEFYHNSYS